VATFLIFLSCFVFLLFSKHIVNPKFQKRLKIPFPGEFIVVCPGDTECVRYDHREDWFLSFKKRALTEKQEE
jgi:hypothetical protein